MVSVGQQISLMCIGRDVRGNIKLSLKATLPRRDSDTNDVVEEPIPVTKQASSVWESIGNVPDSEEEQNSDLEKLPIAKDENSEGSLGTYKTPSFLIRSAAECDEEEKSAGFNPSSESTSEPQSISGSDKKLKSSLSDQKQQKKLKASLSDKKKLKKLKASPLKNSASASSGNSRTDTEVPKACINEKKLKLGTKLNAKVNQIRKRGLVLDLGGGIQGMYRFEVCRTCL